MAVDHSKIFGIISKRGLLWRVGLGVGTGAIAGLIYTKIARVRHRKLLKKLGYSDEEARKLSKSKHGYIRGTALGAGVGLGLGLGVGSARYLYKLAKMNQVRSPLPAQR